MSTSRTGRIIRSQTSWTLPDTRPKTPIMKMNALSQMRISAEANWEAHTRTNPTRHGALAPKTSAPGVAQRAGFRFARPGVTSRWVRRHSAKMDFGAWH